MFRQCCQGFGCILDLGVDGIVLDLSVAQHDVAAAVLGYFGVVGDEDDGASFGMQFLEELGVFRGVLPLCVSEDRGCTELLDALLPFAVESPHYFPDDAYTDMPEKALVAEVLREKMLLNLRDEIPHGTAVTVERFKERGDKDIIDIDVNIYCEKKEP